MAKLVWRAQKRQRKVLIKAGGKGREWIVGAAKRVVGRIR